MNKKWMLFSIVLLNVSGVSYGAQAKQDLEKIVIPETFFDKSGVFKNLLKDLSLDDSEENRAFPSNALPLSNAPQLSKVFDNVERYLIDPSGFDFSIVSDDQLIYMLEAIDAYDIKENQDEMFDYTYQLPFLVEALRRNGTWLYYKELLSHHEIIIHDDLWASTIKALIVNEFHQNPNPDRRQALKDTYLSVLNQEKIESLLKLTGINKDLIGFSIRELHEIGVPLNVKLNGLPNTLNISNLYINSLDGFQEDVIIHNRGSLTQLYMNGLNIDTLQPGVFEGLDSLRTLHMNKLRINTLQANTFNGLTNLTVLGMNNLTIDTLQPGTFSGLTDILWLFMRGLTINTLQANTFNGLIDLEWLNMDRSTINTLQSGAFEGLNLLETLNFKDCNIREIPLSVLPASWTLEDAQQIVIDATVVDDRE